MAKTWPRFITKDLGDTPEDDAEMRRRWEAYERDMKVLIAAGGVHQDADGWWIDDATGELIGPDPELERPRTDAELARARRFDDALPVLAANIKRSRGRPKLDTPKRLLSLRLDADVIEGYKRSGPGWQARMNDTLRKALGLYKERWLLHCIPRTSRASGPELCRSIGRGLPIPKKEESISIAMRITEQPSHKKNVLPQ
jgi:uncharacterized protein (DUF4415 family)